MHFRVTASSFAKRAIQFSANHNAEILRYQEQISSGIKLQRPSEAPIIFRQVTSLRSRFAELEADRASIDRTTSTLNSSISHLEAVNGITTRARVLTQQGIQALDDSERNALALEVDGLLKEMQNLAQAKFNDRFLYSGTKSETPPFEFTTSPYTSRTLGVTYNGSQQRSQATVGDSIFVDTYYSGLDVFSEIHREDTVLTGTTGAQSGAGIDTMIGRANLIVTHDTTTYAGLSGVQAGTGSASDDTIIGDTGDHTLTIVDTAGDGSSGTISLNGHAPVPFTSADTNLRVEGAPGHFVHVDTTNITAGFNGTVDITSTGRMSIDEGQSDVAINYSNNQLMIDSITSDSVIIDSTAIRQVGTDHLEFIGTTNAFQVLHELASDLRNDRGLNSHGIAEALDRRLGDLERIEENTLTIIAEQATALSSMDSLAFRIDTLSLEVETQINEVQATNLPEAVVRLENSQALLQYTYAVTANVTSISLIDFLR